MKKAGTKNAGKQDMPAKETKVRGAKAKPAKKAQLPSERLGVPPTTPDVDAKVAAAEAKAKAAKVEPHSWTRPPDDGGDDAQGAPAAPATTPATKGAGDAPGGDTGERGATAGQPAGATAKSMSLLDAAAHLLAEGAEPMRCKDLVELAAKRGLWTPRAGKTPASTLYAAILREITVKGEASRFVKTERGRFALKAQAAKE